MIETVNANDYRAFCFRGEGRCNLVISAKGRRDGLRIVWRLAKKRKSGLINYKPKCRLINAYLEQFISPFLDSSYLIKARLVQIPVDDLHHLAKIPSLPHNMKVEQFDELLDEQRHPVVRSRFPALPPPALLRAANAHAPNGVVQQRAVCALEMPDATRIPRPLAFIYGPTITLEIKPKQGFVQPHPGIDIPYCNNCILQIEKWKCADFHSMYDFCPLSLYSGQRARMHAALDSLMRDPHRNLRLFVDGNCVHGEDISGGHAGQAGAGIGHGGQQRLAMNRAQLAAALFPSNPNADISTLISAISCILAGVADDQSEEFRLEPGSVLHDLLQAQRMDTIGIVRAYELFKQLPHVVQHELRKKSNLLGRGGLAFLEKADARSLVERYLLAATMKDCSLMISVRLVDKLCITDSKMVMAVGGAGYVRVRGLDGRSFYFAYSVRIVDLDPKSAKNLENGYNRFMHGVRLIRANPDIHPPCVV